MNCYKVHVRETSVGSTRGPNDNYVMCNNGGVLYVTGRSFADVEKIVDRCYIKSIECLGLAYVAGAP